MSGSAGPEVAKATRAKVGPRGQHHRGGPETPRLHLSPPSALAGGRGTRADSSALLSLLLT